jgi:hypothetical protein
VEIAMIWLQSNEDFNRVAEFDPVNKSFKEYLREQLAGNLPQVFHGFFSRLGNLLIAVYGLNGHLAVLIDRQLFDINSDETIEVSGPAHARILKIVRGSETAFEITYNLDMVAQPIPGDSTAFVENEDFDIGLFASNISKDPDRRAIFTVT